MLSDRTKDALDAIRQNVEAIADFTGDMTVEQFSADRRTFYAVTRALEIISEASRRLPDDLKARYPAIRWRAVHDAENVYRHAYCKVSKADVWDTARRQLGDLEDMVVRELDEVEALEPAKTQKNDMDEGSKE